MSDADTSRSELRLPEDHLRMIVETSSAGIILVDPTGTLTFANARMADMLACSLDELIGSAYSDHVHPDQRSVGDDRMRQLIAGTLDHVSHERHYLRRDGTDFWGHLNGKRHSAPDGSLISLVGIITDISEFKATQDSLRESEAKFRTLVESSLDVIFVLDHRGVFQFVSPAWGHHFGYPPSAVIGQDFRPFVHPEDALVCASYLRDVMTTGRGGLSPTYRVRHAEGSWRLFRANGRSFRDAQGHLRYVGVGRDITAQHQLEQEREELITSLRTALDDVQTLKGILPICASCKKIRDDNGYWTQVDSYLARHTQAEFTHGLCPSCISSLYPDLPPEG